MRRMKRITVCTIIMKGRFLQICSFSEKTFPAGGMVLTMILLNADNINKSYTEKPLLQNISLSIHEGEKIGLIGVNGTGKSTLLRILAGAEEPDSGRVTYTNGIRISYLPQNPPYDSSLTVEEQALKYLHEIDPAAEEFTCRSMMTRLGIRDFTAPMG